MLLWRAPLNGDLFAVAYGTFTLCGQTFQTASARNGFVTPQVLPQPRDESRFGLFPLSLAATYGIDVSFFSSRYLDVSVPWVRSIRPMNSAQDDG